MTRISTRTAATGELSLISVKPVTARERSSATENAPHARSVILFNKPYGVLCQFSAADNGRRTLADFVPVRDVYPAGRLDADSEGLVALTADGALQARITSPSSKLAKVYWAQVEGTPTRAQQRALETGVRLRDFVTAPASVRAIAAPPGVWSRDPPIRVRKAIPTAWLEIVLIEGKNRQVRRMTAAVGLPTLRLIRYAIGPWTLDSLAPGAWRRQSASARML